MTSSTNCRPCVGKVPADGGSDLLARQRSGDGERRDDHQEAPDQHRDAERGVVEHRVGGEPRERAAIVAGRRGVGVKDLAEAVRAGVRHAGKAILRDHGEWR